MAWSASSGAGARVIGCRHLDAIDVQAGAIDPEQDARVARRRRSGGQFPWMPGCVVGARRQIAGQQGNRRAHVVTLWPRPVALVVIECAPSAECRRRRDAPRAVGRHHCRAQDGAPSITVMVEPASTEPAAPAKVGLLSLLAPLAWQLRRSPEQRRPLPSRQWVQLARRCHRRWGRAGDFRCQPRRSRRGDRMRAISPVPCRRH